MAAFDGETLLRMVATALVRLSKQRVPDDPVYGGNVQAAYNHVVLACLRGGIAPPGSVPEMVSWAAQRPVGQWPVKLPADLDAGEQYLIDEETRSPTQACYEWAISAPDAAAEQFENQVMEGALAICRAAQSPASYTAFRRLLIEKPVLSRNEKELLTADIDLSLLEETIKRSYQPAPAALLRGDSFAQCARCHCLLVPVESGYRCELDRCRREHDPRVGKMLDARADGGVYQLRRPLRMFVTGPGLAEVDLETQLSRRGLRPEMWPNYDAYDVRITFPNALVWAIDVKDRANPALLARTSRPLRSDPPYDRAFLVIPQYRLTDREDYRRIFNHHAPKEINGRVELVTDRELLHQLSAELGRIEARSHVAGVRGEGREDA